jgi:DsbC/DsbD-like thiol-disulfide interchange protein
MTTLAADSQGHVKALLEIDPLPGWKTYWRDPGDAGMPPEFDLAQSDNLRLLGISYPVPEIDRDEAGRYIGYEAKTSLILDLAKPDKSTDATLRAKVMIGLCQKICLPFQADFNLPIVTEDSVSANEKTRLRVAEAMLPDPPSANFGVVSSGLSKDRTTFDVQLALPIDGVLEIAPVPSVGLRLQKAEVVMQKDRKALIRIPVTRMPSDLGGAQIVLLVKSGGKAMETTLAVR